MYRLPVFLLSCAFVCTAVDVYQPVPNGYPNKATGQDQGFEPNRGVKSKKYGFGKMVVTTYVVPKMVPAASYSTYIIHPMGSKPCGYSSMDNEGAATFQKFSIKSTEMPMDGYVMGGSPGGGYAKENFPTKGYVREDFPMEGFVIDGGPVEGYTMEGPKMEGYITKGYSMNGYKMDGYEEEYNTDDDDKADFSEPQYQSTFINNDNMIGNLQQSQDEGWYKNGDQFNDNYWEKLKKEFDTYYEEQYKKFFGDKNQPFESISRTSGNPKNQVLYTKAFNGYDKGFGNDGATGSKNTYRYSNDDMDFGYDMPYRYQDW